MNSDQLQSIIRTGLKFASGILAAHGLHEASGILNSSDAFSLVSLAMSMIWSHVSLSDSTPPPAGPPRMGGLSAFLVVSALAASAAVLGTGCVTYTAHTTTHSVSNGVTNTTSITKERLWDGFIVEHNSSMFGADIESPSSQNSGTIKFKLGWGDDYERMTPVSNTNLYAPRYASSIRLNQGLTSFTGGGESLSGDTFVGGTNFSASAIVPGTPSNQNK